MIEDGYTKIHNLLDLVKEENPDAVFRLKEKLRQFPMSGNKEEISSEIFIFDDCIREFQMKMVCNPDGETFDVTFDFVNPKVN